MRRTSVMANADLHSCTSRRRQCFMQAGANDDMMLTVQVWTQRNVCARLGIVTGFGPRWKVLHIYRFLMFRFLLCPCHLSKCRGLWSGIRTKTLGGTGTFQYSRYVAGLFVEVLCSATAQVEISLRVIDVRCNL